MSAFDRLRQLLLRYLRPRPSGDSSVRLELIQELRRLNPADFKRYKAASGQVVFLSVAYPNIERYTRALHDAYLVVRDERLIDPNTIPRESFRISLDRFMTTSTGHYVHPREAVQRFQATAVQLCEALEASDDVQYGPAEHNLRMLQPTLLNALQLTQALSQAVR